MALDKITSGIIADDAITAAKLPANSVGASELADKSCATQLLRWESAENCKRAGHEEIYATVFCRFLEPAA